MKKTKKADLKQSYISQIKLEESVVLIPFDVLTVKILSIRIPEKEKEEFSIKITFYDEIILNTVISSSWSRAATDEMVIAQGSMNYDPSNYERMCLFADVPLIVTIAPVDETKKNTSSLDMAESSFSQKSEITLDTKNSKPYLTCNVDILPIFLDMDVMHVRVRMQPSAETSVLDAISWENLPLLTMELSVERNEANAEHQKLLAQANYFKFTLVGCYNLPDCNADLSVFTAASKTTMFNETNTSVIKFDEGYNSPQRFSDTSFYPKWESIRLNKRVNSQYSEKFLCELYSIQNEDRIDLETYLTDSSKCNNIIWASFHRTLLLKETEPWLCGFIRQYSWPFELRVRGNVDYAMMGFLDLFKLLYPGVDTVRLAVPLAWLDETAMQQKCNSDPLIVFEDQVPSTINSNQRSVKPTESYVIKEAENMYERPTGDDGNTAFVIVEVSLRRPFKKPVIPTHIPNDEIKDMLKKMEVQTKQRECTGRGQQIGDWQSTVKMAANSLRRIPYYGSSDFCTIDHQLSLTRTRVEILSSFRDEAAVYVNNNFVAENFLESNDTFEELLLMSHACLINEASKTLSDNDNWPKIDPLIRSARHARYFQDIYHAAELYFHAIIQNKHDANCWRELGTCLLEIDPDWADVCLDKSLMMNPRHPLTLLSKGCIILKKNPEEAEQFFLALLFFHPLWVVGLVAANAYFIKREYYKMADKIMECIKKTQAQGLSEMLNLPRAWERELGDWWEPTPLMPGTSMYYDAADLLLRIRAINLAEVCIAQAFIKCGDSPTYYHLLALCCRLNGDLTSALCHIQEGLKKFGEINCLRALEAECYHVRKDRSASIASFEKAAPSYGSYRLHCSTLLSMLGTGTERSRSLLAELLRRQPSAYTWLAFADEWIAMAREDGKKPRSLNYECTAIKYAIACATEALKVDRQTGRAWSLLAKLVKPTARKVYCARMAVACGVTWPKERVGSPLRQTLCHRLGKTLRECRCQSCTVLVP